MTRIIKVLNGLGLSFISLLLMSTVAVAAPSNDVLPHYNFVEFNIAFILGLSLPVLLIIASLKQLIAISWRFPALITLSVLLQFYAILHLQNWQPTVLLIAAAGFMSFTGLWQLEQQKKHQYQQLVTWLLGGSLVAFTLAVVILRELDVYKLWLAFTLFTAAFGLFVQFSAKKERHVRAIISWLIMPLYGAVLYLWLNVQVELVWLVSVTVLSYILNMVTGSWALVQLLSERFEQIKQVVTAAEQPLKAPLISLDPITNLPTYQQGVSRLKQLIKNHPNDNFVAIVFKPLNFNQVNKVLGHQNSDILLLQLAYNLQKNIYDNETLLSFSEDSQDLKISRLQGLDFLVVFNPKLSSHPTKLMVENLCLQLSQSVPQAMSFKSFSLNFQLAFGVAVSSAQQQSAEQLIAQASDALLEAERSQQTLCYFDQSSTQYTEQQLAKMEKLKQDIIEDKLQWLAHPQISLSDKKLKGFELAIDWQSNDGTRLTGKEFDQIAEYSGEIYRLTKQMIRHAFHLLATMHKLGIEQNVAINLSSKDLLEQELSDFIEEQSLKSGISLTYLTIELTEQVLLNSPFRARMMVDQLKALGVKIAIDDFSGSYESLRYLRRTSVQQVKIECAQLNIEQGVKSEKTIVNALINLIRKMQIPVVATGVNNPDIEKSYVLMGGDVAQGQSLHAGIKLEQIENWLTAWQANINRA